MKTPKQEREQRMADDPHFFGECVCEVYDYADLVDMLHDFLDALPAPERLTGPYDTSNRDMSHLFQAAKDLQTKLLRTATEEMMEIIVDE